MPTLERCLSRIDEVLATAENPKSAYLLRTRLQRTLVSTSRLVAQMFDIPEPKGPSLLSVSEHQPDQLREIVIIMNDLVEESRHLAQQSECFDERWIAGWTRIEEGLTKLRTLITGQPTRSELIARR
jgi:hypothetical protein